MSSGSNILHLPAVPALTWDDCRLLVESVVDYAIFMLDADGRVATWNLGAEKIKGYRADEIVGQHFSCFFLPEDVAAGKPERELSRAVELGRYEDEGWRVRKNGRRFWANVSITALRDERGKLRGFGKVTRDLTARRAAEEQLRQAEEKFHKLVDAVTDYAIYLLDASGHVATWNSGAERTKGYRAEEIVGRSFAVFYTQEDRQSGKPERILETVRRHGRFEEESWRVRKDGTHFWANIVLTALKNDDGEIVGFAKVTRDLTQRRRVEEELRRSEERFRLLVENVADYAIYMLDVDGRVATWNTGAERMKGYTRAEILGQHFARFFPPEDVAAGKPGHELARATQTGRCEDEGWRIRKDGSRFWANAILTSLRDAQGKLLGFAKITRDLTTRREAEEEQRSLLRERTAREVAEREEAKLRQSEARYRALSRRLEVVLQGVTDGITVEDAGGRVVFANAAAARLFGFSSTADLLAAPAEILDRFDLLTTSGERFPMTALPARRALAGEDGASSVLLVRERSTRHDRWLRIRASAVRAEDGAEMFAINILHDVTAEYHAELQASVLREATSALGQSLVVDETIDALARALVPSLADWCSIYIFENEQLREAATAHTDAARHSAARGCARRLLLDSAAVRGVAAVAQTGLPELNDEVGSEASSSLTADPALQEELRALGVGAALVVPITLRSRVLGVLLLLQAESGRRYHSVDVALAHEVAHRAGAAIENAQLYRAAREAARQAEVASRAKDEFLATVSHELRTPLSAMLGWATLLKDRITDPKAAKPIEIIHRNAQAQARIIDDILDVSRVVTGKFQLDPRPADLIAVARDAMEVIRPSAEARQIVLGLDIGAEYCLIVGDPDRLQQVIWNLLSNAVKFTPPGGSVRVGIRQQGSEVVLTVTDTGQGIDPAFLPSVFDRFRQADSSMTRRVGGLGLGLALVRHITELHGGRVEASSAGLGQGATFTVTLPVRALLAERAQSESHEVEPAGERAPIVDLRGVRVLVVDDEPDARELVAALLSGSGATVETAGSAAEGFERFLHFAPDVLVSDIGMPDEDGFSFLRRIRELPAAKGGQIPALALTAFVREEDRAKALRAGYTAHVGKPVHPELLASAVSNLAGLRHRR